MRFKALRTVATTLLVIILASASALAQSKVSGVFKGNDKPANAHAGDGAQR